MVRIVFIYRQPFYVKREVTGFELELLILRFPLPRPSRNNGAESKYVAILDDLFFSALCGVSSICFQAKGKQTNPICRRERGVHLPEMSIAPYGGFGLGDGQGLFFLS